MLKSRSFIVGLFCLAVALTVVVRPLSTSAQVEYYEEVSAFSSAVTVHGDGTMTVVETIDYRFPSPRHGIFRDLPIRYEMEDGRQVTVPIEVLSVDGAPYELDRSAAAIRIVIGDPDVTISGVRRYVITYRVSGAVRYFDDHDEVYWNVTGHDWEVPLRQVTATVSLPDSVDPGSLSATCYTGPLGSTESDCRFDTLGRTVRFSADEGPLTVVAGWGPKGAVAVIEPIPASFWNDYVWPNTFGLVIGLACPLLVLAVMLGIWRRRGRDPQGSGTLVVQYEQPDGLTPAEVGTLQDERADALDVSATIVDLAVRGYLMITELPKRLLSRQDYRFDLLRGDFREDESLRPHEIKVLKVMFGPRKEATLNELADDYKFDQALGLLQRRLYGQLVNGGYFDRSPDKVRQRYYKFAFLLFLAGAFSMFAGTFLLVVDTTANLLLVSIGLVLTGIVVLAFGSRMPRRTKKGVQALEHLRGFREYLNTAERYRLRWQEDEHVFERFLPYAMVFGVVDRWSEAFKDMTLPRPDWYRGQSFASGFNAVVLSRSLGGLQSGLTRAVTASPQRSSGGSGFSGGSSGGGSGGGGGGSW
ncbi:MAG: DUF2207 domain-containing protein [bacterium]